MNINIKPIIEYVNDKYGQDDAGILSVLYSIVYSINDSNGITEGEIVQALKDCAIAAKCNFNDDKLEEMLYNEAMFIEIEGI